MIMLNGLLVAALAATFTGDAETPPPVLTERTIAFTADTIYRGDGTSIEKGTILVKDGVIIQVGSDVKVPEGASVIAHEGIISAGLIALHSNEGAGAELNDSTRTVMPNAEARFALDAQHGDFKRAIASGITAIVLAPSAENLVGGYTAVVKTHGGRVVKPTAQLMLGMSSEALNSNKFPTSYAGALGELRRLFKEPEGPIARAVGGSVPVLMKVGTRSEILRAASFAKEFSLTGSLYGSYWAEDVASEVKESGLDVICSPFDVGEGARGVRSVVALAKAGVRVGFGLDAPSRHPESLRFGAALCVRGGLSPDAARKALTGDAAAIAGVSGRIGRVARGLDADLVLWSADPTSLTASVEAVYIDGKLVYGGAR
ncbi:MAG: imidazolonepropionase-like amidohydrolase [Planctomycetota bacterium]|jgi:imidazolonepropionase-like amidohydrolase